MKRMFGLLVLALVVVGVVGCESSPAAKNSLGDTGVQVHGSAQAGGTAVAH